MYPGGNYLRPILGASPALEAKEEGIYGDCLTKF